MSAIWSVNQSVLWSVGRRADHNQYVSRWAGHIQSIGSRSAGHSQPVNQLVGRPSDHSHLVDVLASHSQSDNQLIGQSATASQSINITNHTSNTTILNGKCECNGFVLHMKTWRGNNEENV